MLRSIVLPAYNEAGYIAEMIERTIGAGEGRPDPFEVIVVDNASKDDTAAIVEKLAEQDPRIRLIRHPENRLYAASCSSGTRAARGERIFVLDSDGQHSPADIWKFDAKLDEGYDLVFGWRVERSERVTRIVMSKVLLGMARFYVGFDLHDVNCGMRGFNRRFADQLELAHRVNFANPEIFVRARLGGFRVGEVRVVQDRRRAGVSSHEFWRPLRTFQTVRRTLKSLGKELRSAR
jgi:glycosyltransferase involved in cell wall biosynthesis